MANKDTDYIISLNTNLLISKNTLTKPNYKHFKYMTNVAIKNKHCPIILNVNHRHKFTHNLLMQTSQQKNKYWKATY